MKNFVDIFINNKNSAKTISKIMISIHFFLSLNKKAQLCIDFPELRQKSEKPASLGSILRIYGEERIVKKVVNKKFLSRSMPNITIGGIQSVEEHSIEGKFVKLRRIQYKNNAERLYRRSVKNHKATKAQALKRIANFELPEITNPCFTMLSSSTRNMYKFYIDREIVDFHAEGTYNAYGISLDATFPQIITKY